MCTLTHILKKCKSIPFSEFANFLLTFPSIVNENGAHSKKFSVLDCTFKKV